MTEKYMRHARNYIIIRESFEYVGYESGKILLLHKLQLSTN